MNGWRILFLILVSILFAVGTLFVFGLVQFGDCYPVEPRLSHCIAGKVRAGRIVLGISAVTYACALWLIVRRRKET